MKHVLKVFTKLVLSLMSFVMLSNLSVLAEAYRYPEVTVPSSGNVMITVDGIYYPADRAAVINRINQIRKEAFDNGYVDRYVPIQWSYALEIAAKTRASEALLTLGHARLTTKSIYDSIPFGWNRVGENLAWNNTNSGQSFLDAIQQWYDEKGDYIKKRAGQAHGVTGHYESLINPAFTYTGLGSFDIEPGKWTAVAQLFTSTTSGESDAVGFGSVTQVLEAISSDISNLQLTGSGDLQSGSTQLSLQGTLTSSRADTGWLQVYGAWTYPTLPVGFASGVTWTSSNPSVATVDQNGLVTAVSGGRTVITATVGGRSVQKEITVGASNVNDNDSIPPVGSGVPMYRLYNPNSSEHFYTAALGERNFLTAVGWIPEGVGWYAPTEGQAVYRLYNPNAKGGDHHYTLSVGERDYLVKVGWKYEGVSWKSGGNVALYRLYNPNAVSGSHHYTTSLGEANHLVRLGWKYEGIAWYGVGEGR